MAYCPKCGVEVNGNKCPLCSHIIKQDIHRVPFSHKVAIEKKKVKFTAKEKKNIFNVSTIFFACLVASVCTTIDYIFDKTLTWAIYPILPVITISFITMASLYLKGIIKVIAILFLFLLMLYILDLIIPVKNFFIGISLPISSITSIIVFILVTIINKSKRKGTNIPGYILLALSLITIFIDLIIQNFIYQRLIITWSLITSVSLIPIALFLLYIHHILSKRIDLNKVFHT